MPDAIPHIEAQIFDLDDQTIFVPSLSKSLQGKFGSMGDPDIEANQADAPGFAVKRAQVRTGAGLTLDQFERTEAPADTKIGVFLPRGKNPVLEGRAVICRAFAGSAWSVSIRRQGKSPRALRYKEYVATKRRTGRPQALEDLKRSKALKHWCANKTLDPAGRYFNTIAQQADMLYDSIFLNPDVALAHGLVVVTGGTGSGKSEIVRHLIFQILSKIQHDRKESVEASLKERRAKNPPRRPHLVTFEDPIEKYFIEDESAPSRGAKAAWELAPQYGIDYTPRERGKDSRTLQQALRDALRQKPSVFFVGETRSAEDWIPLLDFAGTGHLVVTTAHAGSLTEAVGRILRAARATSAELRGEVANRLLAVIHLQQTPALVGSSDLRATVPAVWRRTPAGVKSLVAEGLSSILPHGTPDASSLGRSYFAAKLIEARKDNPPPEAKLKLTTICTEWDLEGK